MKFVQNRNAFRELRNSDEVQEDLLRRAERVRDAALSGFTPAPGERNAGYSASVQPGKNRARAGVVANTPHAVRSNAKNNTLLTALEAARD